MTDAPRAETQEAASPGVGVGETLSRARCSLGLSIDDVAQQLKFNARQIEALEGGRLAELPAGVYTRGLLRSYARLLKLDPEPLLERVAGDLGARGGVTDGVPFRKSIPFSNGARRVNLGYSLLSVAAVAVIAAVALDWPRADGTNAELQFVPATRIGADAAAPTAAPVAAVGTPLAAAVPSDRVPAQPAAVSAATPEPTTPAGPVPAGPPRITLEFAGTAWAEVRDHDGRVLLSRLNPGGTTRVVEGAPPFRLVIGNAQHVKLSYGERVVDLAPYTRLDVARLSLE